MGMAASQARFLTLTARKSNVEYEGQQVNQQRTSLSNESAGLFNKMMALQVPTPPSATDYYNTKYTFSVSGMDYAISDFKPKDGKYTLDIAYKGSVPTARNASFTNSAITLTDGKVTAINAFNPKTNKQMDAASVIELTREYDADHVAVYKDPSGKIDNNVAQIAKVSLENLDLDENEKFYLINFANSDGELSPYYVSGYNMKQAIGSATTGIISGKTLSAFYPTTQDGTKKATATAIFPNTTPEGRFEECQILSITPEDMADKDFINNLAGKTFDLSLTQVQDDQGYDEAMKDYEYQKMLYERTINDINAQTEIIQQQDRTLELRLKQLDTEQNALNTELEAVKKVIETNVEATFKTFA